MNYFSYISERVSVFLLYLDRMNKIQVVILFKEKDKKKMIKFDNYI